MDTVGFALASSIKPEVIDFYRKDLSNYPLGNISGPGLIIIEDDLFVFGGYTSGSSNLSKIYKYNLITNLWTELSPINFLSDTNIYVQTFDNVNIYLLGYKWFQKYNIVTNTAIRLTSPPDLNTCNFSSLGKSSTDKNALFTTSSGKKLYKYNILTDTWITPLNITGKGFFHENSSNCWIIDGNKFKTVNLNNYSVTEQQMGFAIRNTEGFVAVEFGQYVVYTVGGDLTNNNSVNASSAICKISVNSGFPHIVSSLRFGRSIPSLTYDKNKNRFIVLGGGGYFIASSASSMEEVYIKYSPVINNLEITKSWLAQKN